MSDTFVQSRRTAAIQRSHLVLKRFGGQSGKLLNPNDEEVSEYCKDLTSPGQNFFSALFFVADNAEQVVRTALEKDGHLLLEVNSGPLGISGPRLQRMCDARIRWSKK